MKSVNPQRYRSRGVLFDINHLRILRTPDQPDCSLSFEDAHGLQWFLLNRLLNEYKLADYSMSEENLSQFACEIGNKIAEQIRLVMGGKPALVQANCLMMLLLQSWNVPFVVSHDARHLEFSLSRVPLSDRIDAHSHAQQRLLVVLVEGLIETAVTTLGQTLQISIQFNLDDSFGWIGIAICEK